MRPAPDGAGSVAKLAELAEIREQLADLRAAYSAIRSGGVDAVMLGSPNAAQMYTLTSADRPYRVIVDEMGEGAATVSERGILLYANRRLAKMLHCNRHDLIGSDVTSLVSPADRPGLDDLFGALAGSTHRSELNLVARDGTTVPVLTSATGLDIDGVLVRCLVAYDLTNRRRDELRIAERNATIAAHAAQLERANAELTRSNEDLAQFAHITSHDLTEPLRTITGFSDLLRERYRGRLDSDADEFLDYISAGATHMQLLINALLAYSRVGIDPQALGPVDAQQVFDRVLSDLHGLIAETGARIDSEPLPKLRADPQQLAQLFANVVRNSLTFVATGVSPHIRISAQRCGLAWHFTIADNGIGIPAEHRQRVFGMFKRLHSREDYPGTGVGLAIAQKVVLRQGGTIWIQENPGGGIRLNFTIPDQVSDPVALRSALAAGPDGRQVVPDERRKERIAPHAD